jgi:hypothetical protein
MSGTAIDNPYFDHVAGGVTVGSNRAGWNDKAVDLLEQREELVETYSWAIPNAEAIATIVEHDPIIEVCAGGGYWARLVADAGGEIIATDKDPVVGEGSWYPVWEAGVTDVLPGYPDRTLLLVWPPYDSSVATQALGRYEGDTAIYVGEGRGGCTADDRFHQMLHEQWSLKETVDIPTYLGIHDRLEVWARD